MPALTVRTRKFIGMILLVVCLMIYALTVMALAVKILPDSSKLVEALFYVFAGFVWVLPAGVLVRWMQRPDEE